MPDAGGALNARPNLFPYQLRAKGTILDFRIFLSLVTSGTPWTMLVAAINSVMRGRVFDSGFHRPVENTSPNTCTLPFMLPISAAQTESTGVSNATTLPVPNIVTAIDPEKGSPSLIFPQDRDDLASSRCLSRIHPHQRIPLSPGAL